MGWALPVAGGYVTSGYGPRTSPGGVGSTWHRGVDLGGRGTDWLVRSVGPGYVLARGTNAVRGHWVAVRHDDGSTTASQHLASVSASGRVGGGTALGVMGQTGSSTATHLHLEAFPPGRFVLVGDAFATVDRAVDPEPYLRARGVDLRTGTVTVTNPGPGTGGVPDVPAVDPVTPISPLPEEDDMPVYVKTTSGDIFSVMPGRGPLRLTIEQWTLLARTGAVLRNAGDPVHRQEVDVISATMQPPVATPEQVAAAVAASTALRVAIGDEVWTRPVTVAGQRVTIGQAVQALANAGV